MRRRLCTPWKFESKNCFEFGVRRFVKTGKRETHTEYSWTNILFTLERRSERSASAITSRSPADLVGNKSQVPLPS